MVVIVRKSNHSVRQKNKKSEFMYVRTESGSLFKKILLTRDKTLLDSKTKYDYENHQWYIGENSYFHIKGMGFWKTSYSKNIKFNSKYSIQIEVSNVENTSQLIFEDKINYEVLPLNPYFCCVLLKDYDSHLFLPKTTEIIDSERK